MHGAKGMNSRKLFSTVLWAILVLPTSSTVALGQNDPAADRLLTGNGEDSPPSFSQTTVDEPPCPGGCDVGFGQPCCSRWTASADFIILDRIGTVNQTLVTTYPGDPNPKTKYIVGEGTDRLYSSDLTQGFAGGPKVGLLRHGENGYDVEASFFQIDGWNNAASVASGTDTTPVFVAPGGFIQTTDHPTQFMAWAYATRLYNAELNVRWDFCSRVTMLAGFRWINLQENLLGTLVPPTFDWEPPFWNTTTTNNLFGFQVGADGKIFERGRFSLDGLVKAGIFDNDAEESTEVSTGKIPRPSSAATNHAAFVGEMGLQCKYQVAKGLLLKAGYEAIWLEGVALAPGQIQETYLTSPITVQALGVNCNSGVFYHGATAGLEYSF
jgi:hypothetical protein